MTRATGLIVGLALVLAPIAVGAQRLVDPEGVREREESRPLRLRYIGGPVPPGARLETRHHSGWAAGGFTISGIGWLMTAFVGFMEHEIHLFDSRREDWPLGWAFVPFAGPIVVAVASERMGGDLQVALVVFAIAQVGGLAGGLVGALTSVRYVVIPRATTADATPQMRWTLAPGTSATPAGVTFSASF